MADCDGLLISESPKFHLNSSMEALQQEQQNHWFQ